MLKNILVGEVFAVRGKLIKSIEYTVRGRVCCVDSGKNIVVDNDTHIGLIDGKHIQLDRNDYELALN